LRMRSAPDEGQGIPHGADLVVQWSSTLSNQIDSPRFGRLGPVPYHRTGAHSSDGFLCASGPGIPVAQTRAPGSLLDIAPTILTLMGAPCPRELPGKSLVAVRALRSAA